MLYSNSSNEALHPLLDPVIAIQPKNIEVVSQKTLPNNKNTLKTRNESCKYTERTKMACCIKMCV